MQPKKRKIANLITALIIVLIVLAGLVVVGLRQGWFDSRDPAQAPVVIQVSGTAELERSGIASPLEEELSLREGDLITTDPGTSVTIQWGESSLQLDEESQAFLSNDGGSYIISIAGGQLFVQAEESSPVSVGFGGQHCTLSAAVADLAVGEGDETLYLLAGTLSLDGTAYSQGQALIWAREELRSLDFEAGDLDDFCLTAALKAADSHTLICSREELEQLLSEREAQRQAEIQSQLAPEQAQDAVEPEASDAQAETGETADGAGSQPEEASQTTSTQAPAEGQSQEQDTADTPEAQTPPAQAPAPELEPEPEPKSTCTISIRCDTILNNMDSLDPAKSAYVPSSGVILSATTVEFSDGETAYDILQRACSSAGIQLEASYTPGYGSYYIEGINNIYEFDCGPESGWMYQVNGQFLSYGSSSYTVSQGDSIVFCYTCTGLGSDLS